MNRTAQRDAILKQLRAVKTHPTADELYAGLRVSMPQISLGTVYRNLEQMSQAGLIRKLETAGKQKRFDGDISEHFHMRCRICGAVVDIESEKLAALGGRIRELLPEFGCDSFNLELSGCCGSCKEETMEKNRGEKT